MMMQEFNTTTAMELTGINNFSFQDVDEKFKKAKQNLKNILPRFYIKRSEMPIEAPLEVTTLETVQLKCLGRVAPCTVFILNADSITEKFDVSVSTSDPTPQVDDCEANHVCPRAIKVCDSFKQQTFTSEFIYLTF
jgi:hypothetical protein